MAEYYDLGTYTRAVSTASSEAALWANRGLVWVYGFHHGESVLCFQRATALDPECVFAHWGVAYALGPNYNNPGMDADAVETALKHTARALALVEAGGGSDVEKALVRALQHRYSDPMPCDHSALNTTYADAMREVYRQHAQDPDVACLFGEALMNLRPWRLWEDGQMAPGTAEILATLEAGLALLPSHPGLCHMYVHAVEMGPDPGKGLAAADQLRGLVPAAGHLLHMASHIDILLGHYRDAVQANITAVRADALYFEKEGPRNFYTLYRCHNQHFVVYAAMFTGQEHVAMSAARELLTTIPDDYLRADMADWLESFFTLPWHVLIRFGRWEAILSEPLPADRTLYCATTCTAHYARAVALANLQRPAEARAELQLLIDTYAALPASRTLFNNTCRDILAVAVAMATGEVRYKGGDVEGGLEALRRAVVLDDGLPYDEPWGWMQPARHALGALLLDQGAYDEAEGVYGEDLRRHPHNLWALHGLAECIEHRLGADHQDTRRVWGAYREAAVDSEVEVGASCFCRTKKRCCS